MGKDQSKMPEPNNPFEVEQYRRQQYEMEYKRVERELDWKKKTEEKARRLKEKMDKLESPKGPYVPKKTTENVQINYDDEAKKRMQDQLACDSETFILNQLILSLQFFGNYEKELWDAIEVNRILENEKTNLIEKYCKIAILPDGLLQAIEKRIKFKKRNDIHGNFSKIPLYTQSLYVIHENIEVTNPNEPCVYSSTVTDPIYKMEIDLTKPSETHSGYVRLKNSEPILNMKNESNGKHEIPQDSLSENECEDEDEDDAYLSTKINSKHRDSILILLNHRKKYRRLSGAYQNGNVPSPTNSMNSISPASSDYDYSYITSLNTPQPLTVVKNSISFIESSGHTTALPDSCLTNVPVSSLTSKSEESSSDTDDESDESYEVKQYLNSKIFLAYFINSFHGTLASDLGISREELSEATWKGSVIYTSSWEIIPAISCPWPNEAFEWIRRPRQIVENPITHQKFQWLTPVMVNKVVSLGCHVIPLGYLPKSCINPHRELEWKIVFPEAEKYLESCLTSAQAKVYILARLLFLTYVEPTLDMNENMFTIEHLRTHLFWQCEGNYAAWPEDYLGEALIRFLNSLLDCIKQQKLPDYFLPKRNLFENIPEKIMVKLHKRIYRITENPLMHVLNALKNISFESNFGIQLNYKKLYAAIVIDDPLKIINPLFCPKGDKNQLNETSDSDDNDTSLGVIGHQRKNDIEKTRKKRLKKVRFAETRKLSQKVQHENEEIGKENQGPIFDIKFPVPKHMEQIRRTIVYEIFIKHFIEISKMCNFYKSYNQSIIYLKQAARLSSLLRDDNGQEEAKNYLEQIEEYENNVFIERNRESKSKPQLPRKESILEPTRRSVLRIKTKEKSKDDPYSNVNKNNKMPEDKPNEEPSTSKLATPVTLQPAIKNNLIRSNSRSTIIAKADVHNISSKNLNNSQISLSPAPKSPQSCNTFFEALQSPQLPFNSVNFFDDRSSCTSKVPRSILQSPQLPIKSVNFFDDRSSCTSKVPRSALQLPQSPYKSVNFFDDRSSNTSKLTRSALQSPQSPFKSVNFFDDRSSNTSKVKRTFSQDSDMRSIQSSVKSRNGLSHSKGTTLVRRINGVKVIRSNCSSLVDLRSLRNFNDSEQQKVKKIISSDNDFICVTTAL